jgi:hypothetical protein
VSLGYERCSERVGPADLGGARIKRSLRSTFVSTTDGVMTDEVGAITGDPSSC